MNLDKNLSQHALSRPFVGPQTGEMPLRTQLFFLKLDAQMITCVDIETGLCF